MARVTLTVFGATGFTGRFVVEEIARQQATFGPDFIWAIAGRSRASLESIRNIVSSTDGNSGLQLPDIIVANTEDQESLVEMAKRSKLLLNAVGPYNKLGEPVVKAVIAASEQLAATGEQGCDYLDLSGEPLFIESMALKYYASAAKLNISIVPAAAFDSIPADLGVLYAKRSLQARLDGDGDKGGAVVPSSCEMFLKLEVGDKAKTLGMHYTTYAAAIQGFASQHLLKNVRKKLAAERGKPPIPEGVQKGLGSGIPKRKKGWLGVIWEPSVNGYLIPHFFSDTAVVRLSQAYDAYLETSVPPVQFAAWIVVPSLRVLLLFLVSMIFFVFLVRRPWGRYLLLRYPRFFTGGMASHEGPSAAQLSDTSFRMIFRITGHSRALLDSAATNTSSSSTRPSVSLKDVSPDVTLTSVVRGPEAGYVATPALFVTAAKTLLKEREKMRKGVLPPAVAFGQTGLIDEINRDGRIKFEMKA